MAEHLWFVPVAGGGQVEHAVGSTMREMSLPPEINVQWQYSWYPTTPPAKEGCVTPGTRTQFTPGTGPGPPAVEAKLTDCYGSWKWHSCADEQNIVFGGQLNVGTVFSRALLIPQPIPGPNPPLPALYTWNAVEVWAKYRVSNTARLDHIYISICDRAGLSVNPGDYLPFTANNTWRTVYATKFADWSEWDDDNLRVVLTFLGTSVPANVGEVTVDVEWFAIKLSDEWTPQG